MLEIDRDPRPDDGLHLSDAPIGAALEADEGAWAEIIDHLHTPWVGHGSRLLPQSGGARRAASAPSRDMVEPSGDSMWTTQARFLLGGPARMEARQRLDFSHVHLDLLSSRLLHDLLSPIGPARKRLTFLKEF